MAAAADGETGGRAGGTGVGWQMGGLGGWRQCSAAAAAAAAGREQAVWQQSSPPCSAFAPAQH